MVLSPTSDNPATYSNDFRESVTVDIADAFNSGIDRIAKSELGQFA